MNHERGSRRRRRLAIGAVIVAALVGSTAPTAAPAQAFGYQRISGEGSSWSANFIDAMRVNVRQFGITVDYNASGSTAGRKDYLNGTVDFAASDIPFQFNPEDGSAPENPAAGSYAYMPIVAGGTAFMYNLIINGKRVTNLRLSGENVAKIFTNSLKNWNDPAIQADNPGLVMPARPIVPVVRSDGSGSSAQFTKWMINRYPDVWNEYCSRSGRAPACGFTSFYPTVPGMIAQSGDLGIAGYVSQSFAEGAIGYVNYSYALGTQFPVVKVLNAAGYYTEPTPSNVAVSLTKAKVNTDSTDPTVYLTQQLEDVYNDTDPRNYQLSSYSYFILPTAVGGQFNEAKGQTLGAFSYYAMCQGQQQSASLGYSPMPINLVQASFEQITKIPGVAVQDIDVTKCNNPTFSADGTNLLADNAPQPLPCDKQGANQCPNGTGGMSNVPTQVSGAASGGGATATTAPAAAGGDATATTAPAAAGGGATGATTPGATAPAAGGTGTKTTTAGGAKSGTGVGTPAAGGATGTTVAGAGTPAAGAGAPAAGAGTPTAGGGTPAAGVGTPAAGGVPAGQTCDADTGGCTGTPAAGDASAGGAAPAAGGATAGGPAVGGVLPTTLDQGAGSSASLPLVLFILFLVLGMIIGPALAWRYFSKPVTQ